MSSNVIEPLEQHELSEQVKQFLALSGLRDKTITACNRQTRLYHDLRIYGEAAEDCLDVLATKFGVDLSGFPFGDYFPPEWSEGNSLPERILLKLFPGVERLYRKPATFKPLTLGRVEALMNSKKWEAV